MPPPPPPTPPPIPPTPSNSQERMVKLNWEVLQPKNVTSDCFWNKQNVDKELFLNVDKKVIFDGLSQHFSLPNKSAETIPIRKAQIDLRVLDKNVAQNMLISLRGLFMKLSHKQIKQHILDCDNSILNSDYIEALTKFLPQHHEMKQLHNMKNEGIKLADVEQFVATLGDIERLVPRLQCINFKTGFTDMIKDLIPNIKIGIAACEEIVSSNKFGRILTLILTIGNCMTSGLNSAGA